MQYIELFPFLYEVSACGIITVAASFAAPGVVPADIQQVFEHTVSTDFTIYNKFITEENIFVKNIFCDKNYTVNSIQYRLLLCHRWGQS